MTVNADNVVITTTTTDPLTGEIVTITDGVETSRTAPPVQEPNEITAAIAATRILAAPTVKTLDALPALAELAPLYAPWRTGQAVKVGDLRSWAGTVVECVQAHTTQLDWTPPQVPALWKILRKPGAPWVQPLGAQDAYQVGAIVTDGGFTWRATIAANVWKPGVTGWVKV